MIKKKHCSVAYLVAFRSKFFEKSSYRKENFLLKLRFKAGGGGGKVESKDALSRIVTTSDELKQLNILRICTRSMTRELSNKNGSVPREIDHLSAYTTNNPSETNKLLKLESWIDKNELSFVLKKNDKIVAQVQQRMLKSDFRVCSSIIGRIIENNESAKDSITYHR